LLLVNAQIPGGVKPGGYVAVVLKVEDRASSPAVWIAVVNWGIMKNASIVLGLLSLAPALAWAQPSISTVLNAASYDAVVSPGCWVTITGSALADTTLSADSPPLPTSLGGVSVTVNGLVAELLYVSPKQINLVIPLDTVIPENTVVPLIVSSGGFVSRPYNLRLLHHAPAIFTRNGIGTGRALLFDGDSQPVDTVSPGNIVTLYATGLGPTAGKSEKVVEDVEVYLGERRADVVFAGLASGLTGFYRIGVSAPVLATDRLYLRSGGWQSNITEIGIRGGTNVSGVTGSIDGVYPSSDVSIGVATGFALMLHVGTFSTSLDITPSAGPFDIAAVGEGGGAIISIDPTASCENDSGATSRGKYAASISTVTPDGARGDFSGSIYPLWDYSTCDPAGWACLAFPLSTIPEPRLGRFWTAATQALPGANALTSAGANAFLQGSGCLADLVPAAGGSHLVIDAQSNRLFSVFGGFQQLALGPSSTRVSTFKLYVDGVRIASKDLSYKAPYRP
jgi:uncharacterized protein (TIGR03437 family)